MPVIKIKRTPKKTKKKSPVKRKKSISSKKTPNIILNKMENLLNKNQIKIDDSLVILKRNIDKLVKEINNDPNITKEKKNRIIFELFDIYSRLDINTNNPEDYSKLNDLYRRFDNIVKSLDEISSKINEKRRTIYNLFLKTIKHSITLLVIYYFEQLFIYFIGLSVIASLPGPTTRFIFTGISISKFLYLVFTNLLQMWYTYYQKFMFEGVLPLLNDILKVVFKTFGVTFYSILDFTPNLKNWLDYLYNYIVPIDYKSKFN